MKRSVRLIAICVLALGSLVAGCGDDEEGGADKEAFIKKGNAICAESNEKAGAKILIAYERPEVGGANSEQKAVDLETTVFMPMLIEDAEGQLGGIGALEVPSGDDDEVEAITEAYEGWIERASETPREVVVASDIFNEARKLAGEYGLVKCEPSPYRAA